MIINLDASGVEPLPMQAFKLGSWQVASPIVFTSFGFQIVCHSLANYCNNDARVLKKAFLLGSFITFAVYVLWIFATLTALSAHCPEFYAKLIADKVEVGELITNLAKVTNISYMQSLIWAISAFAIVTSAIGVGLGLLNIWQKEFDKIKGISNSFKKPLEIAITVVPPFIIAISIPNAFIQALSFAGMVMVFQTIIIPLYLLRKADIKSSIYFYPFLSNKILKTLLAFFGCLVLLCEILNILG